MFACSFVAFLQLIDSDFLSPQKPHVLFSDSQRRGRDFELIKSCPLYLPLLPSLLNLLLVLLLVPLLQLRDIVLVMVDVVKYNKVLLVLLVLQVLGIV